MADVGTLHAADDYPPPQGQPLTAAGTGMLPLVPGDTSGTLIAASYAANAVNVPLAKPPAGTLLLGEPKLTLDYSGTASNADGRVYAQLISDATHRPLGNQVTPVPVTLDGQPHAVTLPIEAVAADAGPSSSYTLQITDGANDYFAAREAGLVSFSSIRLRVPTVAPGGSRVEGVAGSQSGAGGHSAQACTSRRAFTVHVRRAYRGRVVSARVLVGRRVVARMRGGRQSARIDLRGLPLGPVTVRIVMHLRNGRTHTDTRHYRLCTPRGHPGRKRRRHRASRHAAQR